MKTKEHKFYSNLFDRLYPIPRSITGNGYRKSLDILKKHIPFKIYKFKSGSKVFDWKVPMEWVIKNAFLKVNNNLICNYKNNNISVVNYSTRVKKKTLFKYIKDKVYTLKEKPKLTPYVTSYYKKDWGFCLPYNIYKKINLNSKIEALIDSKFKKGSVDIGVKILKGNSKKLIIVSSYLCHPSMANNELSGPLVMIGIYKYIESIKNRKFTYLFLINPETIGSLCFLKRFKNKIYKNFFSGFVLTCLGGNKKLNYKLSKKKNSFFDRMFTNLFQYGLVDLRKFDPTSGSDERQFCSPGFNFGFGQISRLIYKTYKEHHTDGDNKKIMGINNIISSKDKICMFISILEFAGKIKRVMPYGEIQLSKYNLYPSKNFHSLDSDFQKNKLTKIVLGILSYADGIKDIIDIANDLRMPANDLIQALKILIKLKLIKIKL